MIGPDHGWSGTAALRISRWYDARPDDVFRAFTDPGLLRQWWGPRGFTIEHLEFPAVEGGRYVVRLTGPDGQRFAHEGEFLHVDAPRLLAYTWRWTDGPLDRSDTLVELSFTPSRGGVLVELCHSRFVSQAECEKHAGWHDAFDALASWLLRQAR